MNCKTFLLIIFFFILSACNQYDQKDKEIKFTVDQKYRNSGFTLVYNDSLKKNKKISKKLDNRSLKIFHKTLKKNSFVKITNPLNEKTIIAEVVSNNVKFSEFYNSVITLRIAEELSLNFKEPYINLDLISQNSTFIAKKAKTFNEEKNVANKAPVTDVNINIIFAGPENNKIQVKKNEYIINIGEFYYLDSANIVKNRLIDDANLSNIKIKKLSENKFRVYMGTYSSFITMKDTYFAISKLGFEHLDIMKIN